AAAPVRLADGDDNLQKLAPHLAVAARLFICLDALNQVAHRADAVALQPLRTRKGLAGEQRSALADVAPPDLELVGAEEVEGADLAGLADHVDCPIGGPAGGHAGEDARAVREGDVAVPHQ